MKIDIEPIIESANYLDNIALTMRGIEELYVIRLANGEDYTVKMEKKSLDSFCASRNVSDVIEGFENNIIRRFEEAKKAIETGLHPTEKIQIPVMFRDINGMEYPSGKTKTVRKPLEDREIRYYKRLIKELPDKFGTMQFIKIVL